MSNFRLDFNKYDKYGQKLTPGDVCVRLAKNGHDRTIEFCIYEREVRGSKSKGTFGRFITPSGARSIKYTSVIFVFDTLNETRARTTEITEMTKKYYEGNK